MNFVDMRELLGSTGNPLWERRSIGSIECFRERGLRRIRMTTVYGEQLYSPLEELDDFRRRLQKIWAMLNITDVPLENYFEHCRQMQPRRDNYEPLEVDEEEPQF